MVRCTKRDNDCWVAEVDRSSSKLQVSINVVFINIIWDML